MKAQPALQGNAERSVGVEDKGEAREKCDFDHCCAVEILCRPHM